MLCLYLSKQFQHDGGLFHLVFFQQCLEFPNPSHSAHIRTGTGFPQHPGQLVRPDHQRTEQLFSSSSPHLLRVMMLASPPEKSRLAVQTALPAQLRSHNSTLSLSQYIELYNAVASGVRKVNITKRNYFLNAPANSRLIGICMFTFSCRLRIIKCV